MTILLSLRLNWTALAVINKLEVILFNVLWCGSFNLNMHKRAGEPFEDTLCRCPKLFYFLNLKNRDKTNWKLHKVSYCGYETKQGRGFLASWWKPNSNIDAYTAKFIHSDRPELCDIYSWTGRPWITTIHWAAANICRYLVGWVPVKQIRTAMVGFKLVSAYHDSYEIL